MSKHCSKSNPQSAVSRRDFMRLAGLSAAGLLIQSCQSQAPSTTPVAMPAPTTTPVAMPAPTTTPIVVPTRNTATQVSIGQVRTYDRGTIESQVRDLIDGLGGLGDVVKPGDAVAIKTNLTGGVNSGSLQGVEAVDSFVTHPEVVRALTKAVKAAGAAEIFIVEAVYEWESYRQWGYEDIAEDTGAILIDLNDSKPYNDFHEAAVPAGSFVYNSFIFNPIIDEVDVFMSVSKMKNHYLAGVTHTMKNLYGLVPYRYYRLDENDEHRSGFHGVGDETRSRLPRIIADLNRARPIDFSLVDGIKTTQGGEGPWIQSLAPIEPGLLLAGKNCVATDSVATALMGHDPMGEFPNAPYLRCDNHLNIAAALGLGSNSLEDIEVVGQPIATLKTAFSPAW